MRIGVMVTNGGPHPPEKWAEQSAAQLVDVIQIEPGSPVFEAASAAKAALKTALAAALVTHHDAAQSHERYELEADRGRLASDLDASAHLDDAAAAVIASTRGTMFEAHYRKPAVAAFVRNTLASHFGSAMHIERSWCADRNPDCPHATAWRERHHPGEEA